MNRYQDIIGRINYALFLVAAFLLPFPQLPIRYACVAWVVGWFLEGRWLHRPLPIRQNKTAIPFILFGLWYVWQAASYFWCADKAAWGGIMERYLTFALIVPIGLWGVNRYYNVRQTGKALVLGCVIAVPAYVLWMAALYHHPEWEANLHLSEPLKVYGDWWTFLSENISLYKHRLFLCSVELFGVVVAVQLWHKQKWPLLMTLPVMLSAIPLTASRQSVLTVIAMAAVGIICMLPHAYRWWVGAGVVLLALFVGGGTLMLHPRMQQFELNELTELREVSLEHESRLNIWAIALETPKDYLAHGLGAGQSTNYLVEKYKEKYFNYYASKRYNAHNQYLEQLMELGVPGLLFFLLMWLSVPLCAKGKGRPTAWLFFALFVFNMFTDCMFGRFCGIALWAVGMLFILLQSDTERQQ
ncbi:MAG: O-antigen ligase family protein [Paludibacteraceae bacterium]|nr:O-antigen ligase family protein [Paludibacteraceae bacterium]